jgi:hypothetical protein
VSTEQSCLSFDVPGGRLAFRSGQLDVWAEHLTWCYRMLGLADGATIAVQDFGSSPLSFLGSRLLMPWLGSGIAERMGGRFLCLDASAERITLTPALLMQLSIDALVIRRDAVELLEGELRKKGLADLAHQKMKTIVVVNDEPYGIHPAELEPGSRLLHIENALILAPECARCGGFHLREGVYETTGRRIHNLRLAVPPYELQRGGVISPSSCSAENRDWCVRFPSEARGI